MHQNHKMTSLSGSTCRLFSFLPVFLHASSFLSLELTEYSLFPFYPLSFHAISLFLELTEYSPFSFLLLSLHASFLSLELTEYVVTRWYRAPELLCDSCYYGKTVDMWSLGCIFAEVLGRKPFFQGSNPLHQLETIVSKLGLPPKEQLTFVTHPAARKAILGRASADGHPAKAPKPLLSFFPPGTNPQAVALLARMLTFHPEWRITVDEALAHPYLHELHSQMDEPACEKSFDFSWEKPSHYEREVVSTAATSTATAGGGGSTTGGGKKNVIPKVQLQRLMYAEMLFFRGIEEEKCGGGEGGGEGLTAEGGLTSSISSSSASSVMRRSSSSLGMSGSGGRGGGGASSNPNLPPPPSTAAALQAFTTQRQQQREREQAEAAAAASAGSEGKVGRTLSSSATGAGEAITMAMAKEGRPEEMKR